MKEKEFCKKNRGKLIVSIVVLIAIAYVSILFLIPNLILEYQLYYVQGRLTEWPGYGGLNYTIGDTVFLDNAHSSGTSLRKGHGWGNRENGGSWTVGDSAELFYVMGVQQNLTLTMEISGMLCESFQVFVNDNYIGDSSGITDGQLALGIPSRDYKQGELLVLKFMVEKPVRPCDISDSADDRVLGIQVQNVIFLDADSF